MGLWYGSRHVKPNQIVKSGFKIEGCGMWGHGIQFESNPQNCCPQLSFPVFGKEDHYQVFLVNVLVGNSADYRDQLDPRLFKPPKREDGPIFNSVKGALCGSDTYTVYEVN